MSKTDEFDEFDEFIKSGLEKNKYTIEDGGFSERVISKLPKNKITLINRKFILYLSAVLSVLIFYISNGYKSLFLSIIDIFNNGLHLASLISLFVIFVFISVSFILSRIENNEDVI